MILGRFFTANWSPGPINAFNDVFRSAQTRLSQWLADVHDSKWVLKLMRIGIPLILLVAVLFEAAQSWAAPGDWTAEGNQDMKTPAGNQILTPLARQTGLTLTAAFRSPVSDSHPMALTKISRPPSTTDRKRELDMDFIV